MFRPHQRIERGVPAVGSAWEDTPFLVAVSEWLGKLSFVVVASSRCALSLLLNEQSSCRRQWGIRWISLYYEQVKSDCTVLFLATTHPTSISSTARLTYIHRITGTVRGRAYTTGLVRVRGPTVSVCKILYSFGPLFSQHSGKCTNWQWGAPPTCY
jgi:hypothetical protein